jgi:hypothetical protein
MARNLGKNDAHIYFPFRGTKQELKDAFGRRPLNLFDQRMADLIIDQIQPYPGGNDALWSLNRLDNLDKHRLLIPVAGIVALTGVYAEDENRNVFMNITLTVSDDGRLLTPISTGARLHIKNPGQPAIAVMFGTGQCFENESVPKTLSHLIQLTARIVQQLTTIA